MRHVCQHRQPGRRRTSTTNAPGLAVLAAGFGALACTASCDSGGGAARCAGSGDTAGNGATRGDAQAVSGAPPAAAGQVVTQRFNKIGWTELNKAKLVLSVPLGSLYVRTLQYAARAAWCGAQLLRWLT